MVDLRGWAANQRAGCQCRLSLPVGASIYGLPRLTAHVFLPVIHLELSELIRSRIRSGHLPAAEGYRLYGGKGDGSLCACCDRCIGSTEIQFEVECPVPRGRWTPLPMHLNCFHAWCSESRALAPRVTAAGADSDAQPVGSREQL